MNSLKTEHGLNFKLASHERDQQRIRYSMCGWDTFSN